MKILLSLLYFGLVAGVTACGGGGSEASVNGNGSGSSQSSQSSVAADVNTGYFINGPVINIGYRTESLEGVTGEEGDFKYRQGENVEFYIGDLVFPSVVAKGTITPLDLADADSLSSPAVINITRLLQSLDIDANPANGISIGPDAASYAVAVDFFQSVVDFENDSGVTNLIANSGSTNTVLVSEQDAISHLQSTLNSSVNERVVLSADGTGNTYELINQTLGGTAVESPVCDYSTDPYGRRITDTFDDELDTDVFAFHIITDVDGDRCISSIDDRQRIEIKTYGPSPDNLKAFEGDVHTYRWKFKLDNGFQPSFSFTHIFQIKASGGSDDGPPIITLTPREMSGSTPDALQVVYTARDGFNRGPHIRASAPLSEFEGEWVDAYVRGLNKENGFIEVVLTRISDGEVLLSWTDSDIDMWRSGANFNRPKWGIYRSLNNIESLRDETVWFNDFCIAKGTNTCPGEPVDIDPPVDDSVYDFESDSLGQAPSGFDVNGPVVVSDDQARSGDQSVRLSHPVEEAVNMRKEIGVGDTGSLKASIFIPEDVGVDSFVSVYGASFAGAERVIDLIFKPDGMMRYRDGGSQVDIQNFPFDTWIDIEIYWDELSSSDEFVLVVDGDLVGTFAAANPGLVPGRIEFKFGQNNAATSSESIYIDDVAIGDSGYATSSADFDFEQDALGVAPSGFDANGPVVVSADRARLGNQSVRFSHPVEEAVNLRTALTPSDSGSLSASIYVPDNVGVDSFISVYAGSFAGAERIVDIIFKPEGDIRRREGSSQVNVATYDADQWHDVHIQWDSVSTSNEFTLSINGDELGSFPVAETGLVPERVEFKFGQNNAATSSESIYIDEVTLF